MPIYEYECIECGHKFDKLQKINDPDLNNCPQCNLPSLQKLVSAAGFQLKGTGWYVTDFRDKGKNLPDTKTPAASKTEKKAKPTEAAPAPQSEKNTSSTSDKGA